MKRTRKGLLDGVVSVQQMKVHVKDGLTDDEIADMYLVDDNTVFRFRKKHGIEKQREKVTRNVDMYYRMKECQLTDEKIAYIWNMSRRALTEWKKREGIDGIAIQNNEVILRREKAI